MPLSLYDVSVPVFTRGLRNMAAFLEKGRLHAESSGMSERDLLEARLHPDMHPLPAQVQRASDSARFVLSRVGQQTVAPIEDDETSFADLQGRIAATLDVLAAAPADCMDGREEATVVLKTRASELTFTARDYVLGFAVPNFYFHVTTAYAILRHKGVPVGKMDFLRGGQ
jgi:hypothetical protein